MWCHIIKCNLSIPDIFGISPLHFELIYISLKSYLATFFAFDLAALDWFRNIMKGLEIDMALCVTI